MRKHKRRTRQLIQYFSGYIVLVIMEGSDPRSDYITLIWILKRKKDKRKVEPRYSPNLDLTSRNRQKTNALKNVAQILFTNSSLIIAAQIHTQHKIYQAESIPKCPSLIMRTTGNSQTPCRTTPWGHRTSRSPDLQHDGRSC